MPPSGSVTSTGNVNASGQFPVSYEVSTDPTTYAGICTIGGSGAQIGYGVSTAIAINGSGWVTGKGAVAPADAQVYNGSTWTDLGTPCGNPALGRGLYARVSWGGDRHQRRRCWLSRHQHGHQGERVLLSLRGRRRATMVDLGNLSSYYSGYANGYALAINDSSQIVGYDFNSSKSPTTEYAFLAGTTRRIGGSALDRCDSGKPRHLETLHRECH